ncbi:hypothetical protein ACIQOV_27005, partial [Kitasatospora sp. NPDC091257]|uniref:hypothetical protein n=1 Tax=Kitasatospora sp. NPDC091257 TaxID=3364084 RepID=UPI003810BCD6
MEEVVEASSQLSYGIHVTDGDESTTVSGDSGAGGGRRPYGNTGNTGTRRRPAGSPGGRAQARPR